MIAAIDPSLFTWTEGAVRVQTNGIARGLTILYNKQKRYVVQFLGITPNYVDVSAKDIIVVSMYDSRIFVK